MTQNEIAKKDSLDKDVLPKESEPKTNDDSLIDQIPHEIQDQIPPEIKRLIVSTGSFHGQVDSPITKKINEEHITKIIELSGKEIDNNEKENERYFSDAQSSRRYNLTYVIIFCLMFGFITVYLCSTDTSLYKEVIKSLILYGGGFGSGFGYKIYSDNKNKRR
ncbi:MAG: hypothetical protein HQK91_07390 [Nitrospirae bacterium]|nr:hypothetical protein [Nitrospirota bacterium]MBF0541256.1 hypothetical protein [Nitrospirota bacterium]